MSDMDLLRAVEEIEQSGAHSKNVRPQSGR
jgi:hypothetical protein